MSITANRLRECRKWRGLRQSDMTELLNKRGINIGRTAYQSYEAGRVTPSHKVLVACADILKVDISYLYGKDLEDIMKATEGEYTVDYSDKTPDIKKHLIAIINSLHDESTKYDDVELTNEIRNLLISSIEQTLRVGNAMIDKGDKGSD